MEIWSPKQSSRSEIGIPLTYVPEGESRSRSKKPPALSMIEQCWGATAGSSSRTAFDESLPMERVAATGKLVFFQGPLMTVILGAKYATRVTGLKRYG